MPCGVGDLVDPFPQLFVLELVVFDGEISSEEKVVIFLIYNFQPFFEKGPLAQEENRSQKKQSNTRF